MNEKATHPLVSIIIPSFNRRDDLNKTLNRLSKDSYPEKEIIVVDNGSTDGTIEFLKQDFPFVQLIALGRNIGAEARNFGVEKAHGDYLLMLDSDSYPHEGSIENMVRHFQNNSDLGAAAFRTVLPNQGGIEETGGSHNVFVGCGCGFRKDRFLQVGGFPKGYGFYVEEYDLSYRLIDAGFRVRYFEDLIVYHLQSPVGRNFGRIVRFLVRNNLYLYFRYFPYAEALKTSGWVLQRYRLIARANKVERSFLSGVASSLSRIALSAVGRKRLCEKALDQVVPDRYCAIGLKNLAKEKGLQKVVLWGVGKDFAAMVRGAKKAGLSIVGAIPTPSQKYTDRFSSLYGVKMIREKELENLGDLPLVIASFSPGETHNEQIYLKKNHPQLKATPLYSYGSA